jgi:hypothetical protein
MKDVGKMVAFNEKNKGKEVICDYCDVHTIFNLFKKYLGDKLVKIKFFNVSGEVTKEIIMLVYLTEKMSFDDFMLGNDEACTEIMDYFEERNIFHTIIMGSKIEYKFMTPEDF